MLSPDAPLRDAARNELTQTLDSATTALVDRICRRHGETVLGIVFYGSILRGLPVDEGILDLMCVVEDYGSAYKSGMKAWANAVLPPNVFYLECQAGSRTLRCKYTLITAKHLQDYVNPGCTQVYFWGRFAQPCVLAYSRDERATELISGLIAQAQVTFLAKVLPLAAEELRPRDLWILGLNASYGAELRAEKQGVGQRLFDAAPARYEKITALAAPLLGLEELDPGRYSNPHSAPEKARRRWRWRGRQGKVMNFLRLLKAVFTFDGGVDYALWKIERHTGITTDVPDRARRHPLIFGWAPLFRLWRKGAFR